MPLFGKKKNDGKKPYPTQQPAYPTQGQYPNQPAYNPQVTAAYQQQAYGAPPPPQGAGYPGAPPPYSATAAPVPQAAGYPQAAAGYPQAQPVYNPPQQQQTVMVHGGFDAGARFDGTNPPSIPPPPPGCMANAAQMASSQGQNVVVSQKPSNWMTGGSDGGYTMW